MNDVEKLRFIADVEDSKFSSSLKEALIDSLDEKGMLTFDNVEDAIKYMNQIGGDTDEKD